MEANQSLIYSIMVSTWTHRHWIPSETDLRITLSTSSGLSYWVNLNQTNYETDLIRQTCYKQRWRVNRWDCVIQPLRCCSCSSCGDIISLWPPPTPRSPAFFGIKWRPHNPPLCPNLWCLCTEESRRWAQPQIISCLGQHVLVLHVLGGFFLTEFSLFYYSLLNFWFLLCEPLNLDSLPSKKAGACPGQVTTPSHCSLTQQHFKVSKQLDSGKTPQYPGGWRVKSVWNIDISELRRQIECLIDFIALMCPHAVFLFIWYDQACVSVSIDKVKLQPTNSKLHRQWRFWIRFIFFQKVD